MRPTTLDDFVGQEQAVGEGTPLNAMITARQVRSVILWGPPGTGKTTLAHMLADAADLRVTKLSAVSSGVADVRKAIADAERNGRIVLFIDEIHRFNRSQQDALLGAVEAGTIVLVGATTENPFYEVNSALVSRCVLVQLQPLEPSDVETLIDRACERSKITIADDAREWIASRSGGDARVAYGALEAAAAIANPVTLDAATQAMTKRVVRYDKRNDRHYDVISAFIKSIRGSDPDAAMRWLEEMIEGGEDPRFIARRLVILASEDVGLAHPQALVQAVAVAQAVEHVGLPEAEFALAQGTIYLAICPKSDAVGRAMGAAKAHVRSVSGEVPLHLRSGSGPGYGDDYVNPHRQPDTEQSYWPEGVKPRRFYKPEPHVEKR